MADFTARLGHADHPGLLDREQRLARIERGRNPYVTGASLASDSPVFCGRKRELAETLAVLRRPDKPGNVSVLGERRFGKSSFLNQVYGALAAEPDLVSIRATTQDWSDARPERFFGGLHRAILQALDRTGHSREKNGGEVRDYSGLRDFIGRLARKGLRCVFLLDELERITGGKAFDADFFGNLRALGERPEYRFGYLIGLPDMYLAAAAFIGKDFPDDFRSHGNNAEQLPQTDESFDTCQSDQGIKGCWHSSFTVRLRLFSALTALRLVKIGLLFFLAASGQHEKFLAIARAQINANSPRYRSGRGEPLR